MGCNHLSLPLIPASGTTFHSLLAQLIAVNTRETMSSPVLTRILLERFVSILVQWRYISFMAAQITGDTTVCSITFHDDNNKTKIKFSIRLGYHLGLAVPHQMARHHRHTRLPFYFTMSSCSFNLSTAGDIVFLDYEMSEIDRPEATDLAKLFSFRPTLQNIGTTSTDASAVSERTLYWGKSTGHRWFPLTKDQ